MTEHLRINPRIVAEEFEGETVLIDVEKGLYFSLQGAAIDLWRAFASGGIAEDVINAYVGAVPAASAEAMGQAVSSMKDHELVVPAGPHETAATTAYQFTTPTYVAPVVEAYSDLAELIAIDPVHEVDVEAGWPLRPTNFPDVN